MVVLDKGIIDEITHSCSGEDVDCGTSQGGKLDLTEVEGIADLLAAETSTQHRQAGTSCSKWLQAVSARSLGAAHK